mgnify:CR=1 FL=1
MKYKYIKFQKIYAYILLILYSFLTYYILITNGNVIINIFISILYISTISKVCLYNDKYNYIERYSEKIQDIKIYNLITFTITTIIFIIKSIFLILLSQI